MIEVKTHKLILFNDDENTYLYVTAVLVKYCKHHRDQAEQCALITNNVGKCQIKSGSYLDMFELKAELDELSLNVQIEEYAGDMQ